ncbi:rhodanese-like domain-containing protein [Laspinema olomoucense]|uniref:rhodanese-like domain-containing protein n=1 Tax=Laspinema olomoucense TaxID=3231600 RepID=UPI0021BBAD82|nr:MULTISPECIES: rhodanese-like domain-containing protein [unclassified Laspinema]MCT7973313.1 rhodanese-like domain-containing protein [Laspinema sp. D3d]MCT7995493.1 rhodanese-like domain-containing protein [Laspinema sp. D3c]
MKNNTTNQLLEIDALTLKNGLDQQKISLLDVRETGEFAGEHIKGATLLPLSQFDPKSPKLQGGKDIVLYCQSGNRSRQAAQKLLAAGVTEVMQLKGGINAWKQAGYSVEMKKNAPISIFRQVQIVAGTLVFTGTVLGYFVNPGFLILSGFVGAGLVFAGISNTCAMGMLLAKLPYNQVKN